MSQPVIWNETGKRPFSCSAVAVQAILVDNQERVLLLNKADRGGLWQFVSGALEAEETVVAAAIREAKEEAGPQIKIRPLGVLHARTFHYDESVRYAISIHYLMAYLGGPIEPGDDMIGSLVRWWNLAELQAEKPALHPSTGPISLIKRAIQTYRLWIQHPLELQPPLEA